MEFTEFKGWLQSRLVAQFLVVRLWIDRDGEERVDLFVSNTAQSYRVFGWVMLDYGLRGRVQVITGGDFDTWWEECWRLGLDGRWAPEFYYTTKDVLYIASGPIDSRIEEVNFTALLALARAHGELIEWLRREDDLLEELPADDPFVVRRMTSKLSGVIRNRAHRIQQLVK